MADGTRLLSRLMPLVLGAALALAIVNAPHAQTPDPEAVGPVSNLPLPRFVSLRVKETIVRRGPSRDQAALWTFTRGGLPVEIIAEFENWRRIRDSEGAMGWVLQTQLSGRRTAIVAPWSKGELLPLHRDKNEDSAVVARLQSGVIGEVTECTGEWCALEGESFSGWIRQNALWGAYPGEVFD